MEDQLKRFIPSFARRLLAALRDRVRHQGKYDYKMKRDRVSALDYTTRYDHKSLKRARKSILWGDDWEGATGATIAILKEFELLGDNRTVVDYGGGIGRITRAVLDNSPARVILVDRSPEMRRHALKYIPPKLIGAGRLAIWSDAEFLANVPSLQGKIDLILFIEALQHIPEPILDELFPKAVSTLSGSGRIFVLGNRDLDVDLRGERHRTLIKDFLKKYVELLREDVWTEWKIGGQEFRFRYERFSFLCRPPSCSAGLQPCPVRQP